MLYLELIFFIVIGYYIYHFIQVLLRMGQHVVLPVSEAEMSAIRKHPEKRIDLPTFQKQKVGILLYCGVLLFVVIMFILIFYYRNPEENFNWALYLTLLLPFSYTDVLNLFAIQKDGILAGNKFIPWEKIKSYQFIPIDMNHRFYGYDREANNGYEMKIKGKFRSYNCVVMTEEMKEKLEWILDDKINRNVLVDSKEKNEGMN